MTRNLDEIQNSVSAFERVGFIGIEWARLEHDFGDLEDLVLETGGSEARRASNYAGVLAKTVFAHFKDQTDGKGRPTPDRVAALYAVLRKMLRHDLLDNASMDTVETRYTGYLVAQGLA